MAEHDERKRPHDFQRYTRTGSEVEMEYKGPNEHYFNHGITLRNREELEAVNEIIESALAELEDETDA